MTTVQQPVNAQYSTRVVSVSRVYISLYT